MRKMFALVIAASLVSMPARADMGNEHKGCYIAMMDNGETADAKYCIRLMEFILACREEERLDDCINVFAGHWNFHNHKNLGDLLPERVARRVTKGCAMMIYNVSESVVDQALTRAFNR